MNALERALLYIRRKKKRSIRLGLLFFVLTLFLVLCGWIQSGTARTAAELRRIIGASFRVEDDVKGVLTNDALIRTVESISNIRVANGENLQMLYSEDTRPIPGMLAGEDEEGKYMMSYYSEHYSELEQNFRDGTYALAEGRHITPEDKGTALISNALARQNGLVVGDQFTATFSPETLAENPNLTSTPFPFTVVGIFEIVKPSAMSAIPEPSMAENAVFIDAKSGHAIDVGDKTHTRYRYGVTFWVDDPRELEQTVTAVREKLNTAHFKIVTDEAAYQQSVRPIEKMETLMGILIVALVCAGTLVLTLVLLLWIRQRTREIGIYLSIGMKKRGVLLQFLIESVLTAVTAWLAAVPVSLVISLLASGRFGLPALPPVSAFLTAIILTVCVAVLATTLASTVLLSLQPRKVLLQ